MHFLIHLPDDLADRFNAIVLKRSHSAYIADLLNQALPEQDNVLYKLAMEVEKDAGVKELESDWVVTIGEGLEVL